MVAMLTATVPAGVTPLLPELLLLPGTPRRDGCRQPMHIQWLQVGVGKGPQAPQLMAARGFAWCQ